MQRATVFDQVAQPLVGLLLAIPRTLFGIARAVIEPFFTILFGLIPAPIRAVIGGIVSRILMIHFIKAKLNKLLHREDAMSFLDDVSRKTADRLEKEDSQNVDIHLLRGQLRQYAEKIAPPAKYPSLYMDIPANFIRRLAWDGRTIWGEAPAVSLAGKQLTEDALVTIWKQTVDFSIKKGFVRFAILCAVSIALVVGLTVLVKQAGGNPMEAVQAQKQALEAEASQKPGLFTIANAKVSAAIWSSSDWAKNAKAELATKQAAYDAVRESRLSYRNQAELVKYGDIWSQRDELDLANRVLIPDNSVAVGESWNQSVSRFVMQWALLLTLIIASAFGAFGSMLRTFTSVLRGTVYVCVNKAVDGLRDAPREALQRWRDRMDSREQVYKKYCDQLSLMKTWDRSPRIKLGVATGTLEFRGHLLAPIKGQEMDLSFIDLMQNMSCLGGTGEGKSRNVYLPMTSQILDIRATGRAEGKCLPVGLICMDDKGAIGLDVTKMCAEKGMLDDLLTIGVGKDHVKFDLLEGLKPTELADLIKGIDGQINGKHGDSFWLDMTCHLILSVGTCLQACEYTPAGVEWMRRNQMRMYSLINIFNVASDIDATETLLSHVADCLANVDDQYRYIAHLDNRGLRSSIQYLAGENWMTLVQATKDGVVTSLIRVLKPYIFEEEVASGFCDGWGANGTTILPGKEILCNKVKVFSITNEHGSAGRAILIMLKALIFREARLSESRNPQSSKDRLAYWANPVPGLPEDVEKHTFNLLMIDEHQLLCTSAGGGGTGIDDATFFNISRSAGVSGILISQGTAAYQLQIGADATTNLLLQMRTKIFLRTECPQTIAVAKGLLGKTMRFTASDWGQLESTVAVEKERGVSSRFLPAIQVPAADKRNSKHDKFVFEEWRDHYGLDDRFVSRETEGLQDEQAAYWRQEDRNAAVFSSNWRHADVLDDNDIMQMGRGSAVCVIQCSGASRVDIVDLCSA